MAERSSKPYQTVSIWIFDHGYTVRGYRRGASYLIQQTQSLDEAVTVAFATDRKQRAVSLVPAEEQFEAFAQECSDALGAVA